MSIQVASPAPRSRPKPWLAASLRPSRCPTTLASGKFLMFYPMDFTFICPTELVGLNDKHGDFADRDCVVLAASTDTVHSHLGWVKADARLGNLKYPVLADVTKSISRDYGVLIENEGIALRGTFLIDPNGVLRWACVNDGSAGRSIDEMIRVLDALQTDKLLPLQLEEGRSDAVVARFKGRPVQNAGPPTWPDRCPGIEMTIAQGLPRDSMFRRCAQAFLQQEYCDEVFSRRAGWCPQPRC